VDDRTPRGGVARRAVRRAARARPVSAARGQIMVLFALLLPALIGFVGLAVDGGRLLAERRHLQAVADAAAWAAATEAVYGTPSTAAAAAQWYASQNGGPTVSVAQPPTNGPYAGRAGYVTVQVERSLTLTLMQIFHPAPMPIVVTATAGPSPGPAPYGLLALSPTGGIDLTGGVGVVVRNSSAGSNNTISAVGSSSLTADLLVTAARGISGSATGLRGTQPNVGPIPDPFAQLSTPPAPATTVAGLSLTGSGQAVTATPGRWTGDLSVGGSDNQVTLAPGVYYFDQGAKLDVSGGTNSVVGNGVLIYLAGTSTINVTSGANLQLTAPTAPPYSGGASRLVVFMARGNTSLIDLNGGATTSLTGTVYAPTGQVRLTGGSTGRLVYGQVLAGDLRLVGTTSLQIDFDPDVVAVQPRPTLLR
jgi:Flp pilus assembly protein TadG